MMSGRRSPAMLVAAMVAAVAAILAACDGGRSGQSADVAVPRPWAYPRMAIYPAEYALAEGVPCGFLVNTSATLDISRKRHISGGTMYWLDVSYPAYGATLRCTFTPVGDDSRERVVDNRSERMALNLGTNSAEQTDVTSATGSYDSAVLTAIGATLTPVQFLSVGKRWVVSGALEMASAAVSPDSVRPIVEAVNADVVHALSRLTDD